jgi:hypothetical protein
MKDKMVSVPLISASEGPVNISTVAFEGEVAGVEDVTVVREEPHGPSRSATNYSSLAK